jgi:glycosyltransferase involved in cell wall biosynthesis
LSCGIALAIPNEKHLFNTLLPEQLRGNTPVVVRRQQQEQSERLISQYGFYRTVERRHDGALVISVIVTVRNEEKHIRDLLDSLVIQERPLEIIIIDAMSDDKTADIVESYIGRFDFIRLFRKGGKRGDCRNFGVKKARGLVVAFTDGDCIANPFWLKELRKSLKYGDVVAGKTITLGYHAFVELERVELFYKGVDLTFPSCNLAYWKEVFEETGGFDPEFVTAEDIDLNFRAVQEGHKITYNENAVIYHRARSSFVGFFKQAFWNGFGRKQLTLKNGAFWKNYKPTNMLRQSVSIWYLMRLAAAMLGYIAGIIYGGKVR